MKRALVVFNSKSGSALNSQSEEISATIVREFLRHAYHAEIVPIDRHLDRKLRMLIEQTSPSIVAAAGGDGTVNAVASILKDYQIPLAIIPIGTFNLIARDFDVPNEIADAVRIAVLGNAIALDVGTINGRCFLNNVFLGFFPDFVKQRKEIGFNSLPEKYWATLKAFMISLYRLENLPLTFTTKHERFSLKSPFVYVGVGPYTFEAGLIARASKKPMGYLSVAIAKRRGRLKTIYTALREYMQLDVSPDELKSLDIKELTIDSPLKELRLSLDGELALMTSPLKFRLIPKGVMLCAANGADEVGRATDESTRGEESGTRQPEGTLKLPQSRDSV